MGVREFIEGMKIRLSSQKLPKHIAIATDESQGESRLLNLKNIIKINSKLQIPMLSVQISGDDNDFLEHLLNSLIEWDFLKENQIKVTILGKWYSLPERVLEPLKKLIDNTKDYDKLFLNLCILYDGQQEIVEACTLLARMVKLGKLDPEGINKELLKENLYTSYLLPPDLLIRLGKQKTTGGLLLWDSAKTTIYFAEQNLEQFGKEGFLKSIQYYQHE